MLTADQIQQSIPGYLTSSQQGELTRQLSDFENRSYYTSYFPEKLFTLNQMGFYLFVLKLSIHFCRFQDGVIRS